ncbi:MAG: ammonium transporter [Reichenbachiella sp.]|uniref:ammonium transporter n=1 Tax=Reichenbachiella sp. TaxID=2184521 RepID=UPI003297C392
MEKIYLIVLLFLISSPAFSGVSDVSQQAAELALNIDDLWVLVAAALVFFMQAGFKVLETGLVKAEHRAGIGAKNLLDWVAGSIAFFLVGYGLMFGSSSSLFFGTGHLGGTGLDTGKELIFFLFQLAFAGTALTIVSGAMSGRTAVIPYFIASLMTATVIYPVFGYWAWGNLANPNNTPWLANLGFMDFAGSTVVHSTGAWIALMGIYMVGPRIGRYDALKRVQPMKSSDYSYSILGVMILWLGWWGFNGGSTLAFNNDVVKIILNTNLAGAAACFSAFFHGYFFQKKKDLIEKIAGGSLTGLVAITACCNVVSPINSLIIGLLAGVIHNYFYVLIAEKWHLDDPVGAIAVHGFGGVFGTLCVALFGEAELLSTDRWTQLAIQFLGITVCFAFTSSIALGMFYLIKKTIGLRVSPIQEQYGSFITDLSDQIDSMPRPDMEVTQVSVRVSERGYNMYSIREYLSIPLEDRKRLFEDDKVQYMDEAGNLVPPLIAVRQLGLMLESERNSIQEERDQMKSKEVGMSSEMKHAGELQSLMLGGEESFKDLFPSSFIFFEPRKIVSGDFYWFKQIAGYKIVIVSNTTSSGVSGGFLSMLGLSLINEIFSSNKVYYPEKVLSLLDRKFDHTLKVRSMSSRLMDSLDVSVLIVEEVAQKIYYAGANSCLHVISKNGILNEYPGNSFSVGLRNLSDNPTFDRKTINYKVGDKLYLFTDGYYDQVNRAGKKISKEVLLSQLKKFNGQRFEDQKVSLKEDFLTWKQDCPQTDDVVVLGIGLR